MILVRTKHENETRGRQRSSYPDGEAGFAAGVPEGGGIEPAPDSVLGLLTLTPTPVLEGALPLLSVPLEGALLGLGNPTPDADDVLAGSDETGSDETSIVGSSDASLGIFPAPYTLSDGGLSRWYYYGIVLERKLTLPPRFSRVNSKIRMRRAQTRSCRRNLVFLNRSRH